MKKIWLDGVWEEYVAWQTKDKITFKKINRLIKSIDRYGYRCEGKPEPLSGHLISWWRDRINKKDRIVFRIVDESIEFLQVGSHYGDK